MATPTIRQTNGAASGAVTSVSLAAGTAVDDILVVSQEVDFTAVASMVAPSVTGVGSWTQIGATVQSGSPNIAMKSWWAPVTAGGARTLSCSQAGGTSSNHVIVHVLTGADLVTPIDGTPATNSGTTGTAQIVGAAAGVSPTTADALLIGNWSGIQFSGSISYTAPGTMVERSEVSDTGGAAALMSATQVLAASGATGTRTATSSISATSGWVANLFAVRGIATVTVADTVPGSVEVSSPGGETITALPGATVVTDPAPGSVEVSSPDGESLTIIPAVLLPAATGEIGLEGLPVTAAVHVAVGIGEIGVEGFAPHPALQARVGVGELIVDGITVAIAGRPPIGDIDVSGPPVQVSYGNAGVPGLGGLVALPPQPAPRFIVQSILTGQFLSWDLELSEPTVTLTLSGPTAITGTLKPEDPETRKLLNSGGFEPWACWIHLEIDGEIRASGILQPYQANGDVLSIEAAGVSAYPHGIPYQQELSGIQVDPADVMRAIWAHLQSFPDGNLGVTVVGSTPIKLGEPEHTEPKLDPATGLQEIDGDGHPVFTTVAEKPYLLVWWDGTDCGSEIASLASQAPFDFVERCAWSDETRSSVKHWIEVGFPRIGCRWLNDGPRFATGENVYNVVPVEETDDLYASQVVVFGKGEGSSTLIGYAGRPLHQRLRRVALVQDKTIPSMERANARAGEELERRQGLVDVTDMEVDARHPNAVFGSYGVGDDVLIDIEVGWIGRLRQYERILSITYDPDGESVRLELRRADAFRYGEGA